MADTTALGNQLLLFRRSSLKPHYLPKLQLRSMLRKTIHIRLIRECLRKNTNKKLQLNGMHKQTLSCYIKHNFFIMSLLTQFQQSFYTQYIFLNYTNVIIALSILVILILLLLCYLNSRLIKPIYNVTQQKHFEILRKQMEKIQKNPLISSLQSVQIAQLNNKSCTICLRTQQLNCLTTCGYYFHAQCLVKWLEQGNKCPVCLTNENIYPVMIFCTRCGKIRDCFKFLSKMYVCISLISVDVFIKFPYCQKCRTEVQRNAVEGSNQALSDIQIEQVNQSSKESQKQFFEENVTDSIISSEIGMDDFSLKMQGDFHEPLYLCYQRLDQ